MKKNNKKGFTLAELLIVVAIIAVLVAISIPVFTSQLERAREATDLANIRAAYAEVMTDYLAAGANTEKSSGPITIQQKDAEWHIDHNLNTRINGSESNYTIPSVPVGGKVIVSVSATGQVSVASA